MCSKIWQIKFSDYNYINIQCGIWSLTIIQCNILYSLGSLNIKILLFFVII